MKIALHTYLFIPLLCFRIYFRDKCKYKWETLHCMHIFLFHFMSKRKHKKIVV